MTVQFDPIPHWDERHLLPPYVGHPAGLHGRSPYCVSLIDLITRFSITSARRRLLDGFLAFRSELHQAGLDQGFQWINGSFVTDVMLISKREPRDIDVATFLALPNGHTQNSLAKAYPDIFDRRKNRARYQNDTLFMVLSATDLRRSARMFAYYNSLMSHTRGWDWKGYLELDLSSAQDRAARHALNRPHGKELRP